MPTRRRLYIHVGLQKTGTSYLQAVMLHNRDVLAEQGLDLVPPTKRGAFELMLLVRNRYNPARDAASVPDSLARFSALLEQAPGSRALLSQESLAAAGPSQIERLLDACGDREVHVIATVRDLARQLPSQWQQLLKGGGTTPYQRFLRQHTAARGVRQRQPSLDPPRPTAVLARWSAALGPDRMHVVTVPGPGSSPTLLLERYCRVLGIDPSGLVPEEGAGNTSLGRVQAEVLQRVNAELPAQLRRRRSTATWASGSSRSRCSAAQERRPIRVPAEVSGVVRRGHGPAVQPP